MIKKNTINHIMCEKIGKRCMEGLFNCGYNYFSIDESIQNFHLRARYFHHYHIPFLPIYHCIILREQDTYQYIP